MGPERARSFFPITRDLVYLNHAGVGPLSTRAAEAVRRWLDIATRRAGADDGALESGIERARASCARLLGAEADEVAFVRNTSEGLGLVANGLDWRRGDRVVTCDLEYAANVYPWWRLAARGVETLLLRGEDGRLPLARIEAALRDPAVRLLSLSAVQYASGFRLDLAAVGALCRERGVLFCVDGIQALGCLALDVGRDGIDFLAAGGHKWLCAAQGSGVFYAARRRLDALEPRLVGTRNVRGDVDAYALQLRGDARRFEEGTLATAGVFALGAAADLQLEVGPAAIEARVLTLVERLAGALAARGARLASPGGPGERSGILAFALADEPPEQTVRRLREQRFVVQLRRGQVRVSPHFYNSDDEIDALIAALGR